VSLCLNHEQRLGIGSGQCTQTFLEICYNHIFFVFFSSGAQIVKETKKETKVDSTLDQSDFKFKVTLPGILKTENVFLMESLWCGQKSNKNWAF
jgi:hypothetical protein